jgi:hypothetical protein
MNEQYNAKNNRQGPYLREQWAKTLEQEYFRKSTQQKGLGEDFQQPHHQPFED